MTSALAIHRRRRKVVDRATRQRIEAAIQAMIDALDALDPDVDVEPSLGSTATNELRSQENWAAGNCTDLESNVDDEPQDDPADQGEPELGSFDQIVNQEHSWKSTGEFWDAGAELDTADAEPSLGSMAVGENSSQKEWAASGTQDLEEDPAENGIADSDALEPRLSGYEGLRGLRYGTARREQARVARQAKRLAREARSNG